MKNHSGGVYGYSFTSLSTFKQFSKKFRLGRKSLEHEPRSGRPAQAVTPDTTELVEVIPVFKGRKR
jgi:hypothetical protein